MTPAPDSERAALERLVLDFTECFNREDLDGVMSYMADDAVYDEFNGSRSQGKIAIRAAFEPQFRGDFGTMRFAADDVVLDAEAGKALITWACSLERDGQKRSWRGLDILHFRGGKIVQKHTYAKTERLLLTEEPS